MGDRTKIEWTSTFHADGTVTPGATWNPIRGCSRVSPGCTHCYAETVAARFSGPGQPYEGLAAFKVIGRGTPKERREAHWSGEVRLIEEHLADPLRWQKPRRVFVNSMSDLFHEALPFEQIDRVFAVMALSPRHTFQVLTKRPARMREYCADPDVGKRVGGIVFANALRGAGREDPERFRNSRWPLPNIWLGTSVEDQQRADERVPELLQTRAAVRFLSCEPLLGPVDLVRGLRVRWQCSGCREYFAGAYQKVCPGCGREEWWTGSHAFNPPGGQTGSGIDWVIVGGESGPGARPMHPDWARQIRDDCQAAGVPFFFKQWGEWVPESHLPPEMQRLGMGIVRAMLGTLPPPGEEVMHRIGKKRAGRLLDGVEWSEFPETQA